MRKPFFFTDDEMDSIYYFILIAKEVSDTEEEKEKLSKILKNIEEQTDYSIPQ
jgi:hypothetical protein